jgi:predicted nucleic-acid-binding protein
MIGLDTDVLVRYMAQDDPIQAKIAADCSSGGLPREIPAS